jgi:hypothetical protein
MRYAALAVLALAAAACSETTAPSSGDVRAHRARWQAHSLNHYSYDYEETGFFICCTEGKHLRLEVLNGVVVSAVFADTGEPVSGFPGTFPTIDALFNRALRAADNDVLSAITFDAAFDYPTRIDFAGPPDASGSVFATDLRVLP